MYYLLSLLSGILISLMILSNGKLTSVYGVYSSTVIIHIVGLIVLGIFGAIKKGLILKRQPIYLYMGGIIGVAITIFCNTAFGRISVSAILALELLGQSITGLIFDTFGLMGVKKRTFNKSSLIGISLMLIGIVSMLGKFDALAVFCAFSSGALLVISQILNAKLSEKTNLYTGTFMNFATGLALSIPVYLILGRNEPLSTSFILSPNILLYLGGAISVVTVFLSNKTILKIPVFYMILFAFVGQVFSGILIDSLLTHSFPIENVIGGLCTSLGLLINLIMDRKKAAHCE